MITVTKWKDGWLTINLNYGNKIRLPVEQIAWLASRPLDKCAIITQDGESWETDTSSDVIYALMTE